MSISVEEFNEVKVELRALVISLCKGKDIPVSNPGSDDKDQTEIKIPAESPATKAPGVTSGSSSRNRPSSLRSHVNELDHLDLDVFQDDLDELYTDASHAVATPLRGFTKFPSNEGCNLSKEEAAHVKQLRACYKALKVVLRLCVGGASLRPEASATFLDATYATLYATRGLLNARRDLIFKGVMGDGFRMWRAFQSDGISDKDRSSALQAIQFSAAANLARLGLNPMGGVGNKNNRGQNKGSGDANRHNGGHNNNNQKSGSFKKNDGRGAGLSAATN
jgi:hypothetical protein